MTGNEDEKSPEAIRQERRRKKMEETGAKEVAAVLGPQELAMFTELRKERGGVGGPYSVTEYISTSIRRDYALLQQERGQLAGRVCENCRKPLPRGCGGMWKNEGACLRASADRALAL